MGLWGAVEGACSRGTQRARGRVLETEYGGRGVGRQNFWLGDGYMAGQSLTGTQKDSEAG